MLVYTDVTELAMGLELAALNRLAATLMPVDRLTEVLRQITVHLPPGLNFLRPVKPEFMYIFYTTMSVHAVTFDGVIRLIIQIPLKETQSTYSVYRVLPLPTYSHEVGRHVQIGRKDKWFAVSADHRAYYELEHGYQSNCKFGHITFCEVTTPRMDRSRDSCLSGLFYGKDESILNYCEKFIVRQKFNPILRRAKTNHGLWVYSVDQSYTFEARCETAPTTRKVVLEGAGWVVQPEGCIWVHEEMTLEARRSFHSDYTVERNPVILPTIRTLFLTPEHQVLQEQPDAVKDFLQEWDALNTNGEPTMISTRQLIMQLQTQLKENKNKRDIVLIAAAIVAVLLTATVIFVWVWKKGFFHKSTANNRARSPATDGGDQDATDSETPQTHRPESRFVSPRLNLPPV